MVGEHTLGELNLLKFIETCFLIHSKSVLMNVSYILKKNVYSAVPKWNILHMLWDKSAESIVQVFYALAYLLLAWFISN